MALTPEQIAAIAKPLEKTEVKKAFEQAAKYSELQPTYIVTNKETADKYKSMLDGSIAPYTYAQIEDAIFTANNPASQYLGEQEVKHNLMLEKEIQLQIAYARAHWPHFKELEPTIIGVLHQWPNATLEKAYHKAYQMVKGGLEKNLAWKNPQGNTKSVSFKGKKFEFVQHDEIATYQSGSWTTTIPPSSPAEAPIKMSHASQPDWGEPAEAPPPKMSMWKIVNTLPLLKKLQPESRKFGYHVCMGGGVLNNWSSQKDLDLYYLPLNNSDKPKPKELIHYLAQMWGKPVPIGNSAEYPHDALPYIAKLKFEFSPADNMPKQRIDLFVMGSEVFDMKECLDSLDEKLPTSFLAKIIHRKRSKK